MRILHVISTFPPAFAFGGPPKVSFDLCKELVKRGHEVEVYTTNAYDQRSNFKLDFNSITISGIKVTYFPNIARVVNFYVAPGIINSLMRNMKNFDLIHVHFGRQPYDVFIGLMCNKQKVPYVLQAHGSLPYIGKTKILKITFDVVSAKKPVKNASKVIALSQIEAEQYRSMGVPEEKIAIIPNGIDLSEYANLPPKGQFKKKFNIPEDKKIVLYLGRIHRIKGIDILVKAYARLTKKMNFKGAVLVIAGPDDGYLSEVKSLVQSLGVSSSVLFTGPLYGGDKLEAYVDSDVYVLPSRYETFPMGLLEAYACGKPVIASNVGGLKELMINGETGLLFEAGNVEQLADRLLYLLNHLNQETKDMGKKAKGFVEQRYSIEKVIDKLESLYEEIAVR